MKFTKRQESLLEYKRTDGTSLAQVSVCLHPIRVWGISTRMKVCDSEELSAETWQEMEAQALSSLIEVLKEAHDAVKEMKS